MGKKISADPDQSACIGVVPILLNFFMALFSITADYSPMDFQTCIVGTCHVGDLLDQL